MEDGIVEFPFGFSENAARALIKSGRIRAKKVGRHWFATKSDLIAFLEADAAGKGAA